MKKVTYTGSTINIVLQTEAEITSENCPKGIMSKDANGELRFEEEIRKGRSARNPKLHDGRYLSMVRMQNGKYQFHMKTFNANASVDAYSIAVGVASEIIEAFKIIKA